MKSPMYKPVSE